MSAFKCKLHSAHYLFTVLEEKVQVLFTHEPSESDLNRLRATIYKNGISIPVYEQFVSEIPSIEVATLLLARYQALPDGLPKSMVPLFPEKS